MNLIGDFHTHTTYTHGTSIIEENVKKAQELGLKAIAITEHSYQSKYHIKHGDLDKMRAEIENIKNKAWKTVLKKCAGDGVCRIHEFTMCAWWIHGCCSGD